MLSTNNTDTNNTPEKSQIIILELEIDPTITHPQYRKDLHAKLDVYLNKLHSQLTTVVSMNGKAEVVKAGPPDPFLSLYNKPKRKPNLADYSYPSDNSPKGFKNGPGPIGN
jgi:hypothetical protein